MATASYELVEMRERSSFWQPAETLRVQPQRLRTTAAIDCLKQSINQSINLFVMKHSTRDIAVTAMTGTTRLKSAYGSRK